MGAVIGFLGVVLTGTAINLGTSLTTTATVILVITCPVIYAIWWKWWLVPILNGLLYGGVTVGILRQRRRTPRRVAL
jgi:hypothetical protein